MEERISQLLGPIEKFVPNKFASTYDQMKQLAHTAIQIKRAIRGMGIYTSTTADEFFQTYENQERHHWLIPKHKVRLFI